MLHNRYGGWKAYFRGNRKGPWSPPRSPRHAQIYDRPEIVDFKRCIDINMLSPTYNTTYMNQLLVQGWLPSPPRTSWEWHIQIIIFINVDRCLGPITRVDIVAQPLLRGKHPQDLLRQRTAVTSFLRFIFPVRGRLPPSYYKTRLVLPLIGLYAISFVS